MAGWLFVLINVAIAGLVGGITNHIAIKMLFHPRHPVVLFGWRVPFTPGLFPKRKQEIAVALGDVVADYLVTPEGFKELFGSAAFKQAAVERASRWLERELKEQATAGDWVRKLAGKDKADLWLNRLPEQAGRWAGSAFAALWRSGGWGRKRLCDAVPGWSDAALERWSAALAAWGLDALKAQLLSPEGQKVLRNLASGLMERASGFVGMLAGLFVDEDKLAARLTPFLAEQLERPEVRAQAAPFIARQLREWGELTLEDLLGMMAKGEPPLEYAERWIREQLPWPEWTDRAERFPVGEWLLDRREWWRPRLSAAADSLLDAIGRHAGALVASFNLPEMVRKQVERFPTEKLERLILNVTGREFKAITWLGVLLGGIIGLIQSVFLLLWS